jgi:hypothetical protein
MSSLALKRATAMGLAAAAIATTTGAGAAGAMPDVPPPPSSIAASAEKEYAELRAPQPEAVPPPPSSIATSAENQYAELRAPQPVVDEPSSPSGFDFPSAAIGAVVGGALVMVLVAAGGLVRRRPMARPSRAG